MKICFITNLLSIHSRRWIEPVIAEGNTVFIVNVKGESSPLTGTVETTDLTNLTNLPKIRFLIWGIWFRRYLQKIRPDLIHSHQIQASGWIGAMSNHHPYIVTAWGSDLLVDPETNKFRKTLTKFVLKKTDILTVPSKIMVKKAIDLGYPRTNIHLIPWGVETEIFNSIPNDRIETRNNLNIAQDVPILFCPRRIVQICNIDTIISSLLNLVGKYPDLRLVLIKFQPDEIYLDYINQLIDKNRLENYIIWLPAQTSQYTMARLYRMADIVISIPSSEGYGFSVYEAIACGTPTVISDLPTYEEEIIEKIHSIKVPTRDVNETSKAIDWLLSDKDLASRLVLNAKEIIKDMGVSDRIRQVTQLYNQIIFR